MKIQEMVDRLEAIKVCHGNIEVTILDGFNVGGNPRTVNCGPTVWDLPKKKTFGLDLDDIKTNGKGKIIVMGYGNY